MQKNPENSSFDPQNNNKSAPKCFCCEYNIQGLQKHQNLKFDLLTIFLPLKPISQNSPMRLVTGFVGAGHKCKILFPRTNKLHIRMQLSNCIQYEHYNIMNMYFILWISV